MNMVNMGILPSATVLVVVYLGLVKTNNPHLFITNLILVIISYLIALRLANVAISFGDTPLR